MNLQQFKVDVDGWRQIDLFPDQLDFFNQEYGISLHISIKEADLLHVSIGPVRQGREDSEEEHASFILKKTPEILRAFFGERSFRRMAPHPSKPDVNHYFSALP